MFAAGMLFSTSIYQTDSAYHVFYAPSAYADGGVNFFIPLSEELKTRLKVPRTSWTANLNLTLLSVQIGDFEVSTGPFGSYVAATPVAGGQYVEANYSFGFGAAVVYHMNRFFGVTAGYKIGFTSTVAQSDIKRGVHVFELRPAFTFYSGMENFFELVMPLRAAYSVDYVSVSVSIGVRWLYSKIMKAPIWLLEQQLQQSTTQVQTSYGNR